VAEEEQLVLPLPFAWEEVDVVTIDRNRYDRPRAYVVVGRKLPSVAGATQPATEGDVSPAPPRVPLEAARPAATRR